MANLDEAFSIQNLPNYNTHQESSKELFGRDFIYVYSPCPFCGNKETAPLIGYCGLCGLCGRSKKVYKKKK